MAFFRKLTILLHRYLGIALCLMFVMWFLSGIGMIYSRGMPRMTPQLRLARMPDLDLSRVAMSAAEAAELAGLNRAPQRAVLFTLMGRPAYRFGGQTTVFADTGELLYEVDRTQATTVASRFLNVPRDRLSYAGRVTEPDQWTMTLTRQLPLYKFAVDDGSGTELYVSPTLAEPVQITTRQSRMLTWVSTIPHFLYLAPLRLNTGLWYSIVVWVAGLACVLAVLGIAVGILQFKRSRLPYSGLTRWHYVSGLVFGVLTLTWAFSGLVSMEPWAWTQADGGFEAELRQAFPGGLGDLAEFPRHDAAAWTLALAGQPVHGIKEIEFVRILGEPHFIARGAPEMPVASGWPDGGHQPYFIQRGVDPERFVLTAHPLALRTEPFSNDLIVSRLQEASPDTPILDTEFLTAYDTYYYSRDGQAPLPVVRVKFDDPASTWLYIDPGVLQLAGRANFLNRVERWLYNGLHALDFPFLYYNRPLWDGVVIVLAFGGFALSAIGLMLAVRRVRRTVRVSMSRGLHG